MLRNIQVSAECKKARGLVGNTELLPLAKMLLVLVNFFRGG